MQDRINDLEELEKRLYYKDSHIHTFDAAVIDIISTKKGRGAELDKTAFFPEGGGQSADTGYIGPVRITDVQEIDGKIIHYGEDIDTLEVGKTYPCNLDWEQRLRRMQTHSGEHIISGIAHSLHGIENVGFHMGAGPTTIDFDKELTWEELTEIERRANQAVRDNIPVKAYFPDSDTLKTMEYRSKLELTHGVRIVEIAHIDTCACCAPHVYSTGEIGPIKILDSVRHRGGIRLSVVCGMDALEYFELMQDNITAISRLLSAKREETAKAVERMVEDGQKQKERIARLSMELVEARVKQYEYKEGNICLFDNILDEVALRETVNALTEKCSGMAGVFSGDEETGYKYIIGSKTIDLRKNSKEINLAIGGKGGGSSEMIQGRATFTKEKIEEYFNSAGI